MSINVLNQAQAEAEEQFPVDFVEIIINDDPNDLMNNKAVRVSTFYGNLIANGNLYTSAGEFLSFSSISDDINIRDNPLTITLSGVNRDFLVEFLSNTIEGSVVKVYRGWISESTGRLVADPDQRWGGFVSASNVRDDYEADVKVNQNAIVISVECRSLLETILNSQNGRYTSVPSFQKPIGTDTTNANDVSMEFVGRMNTIEFPFGKSTG